MASNASSPGSKGASPAARAQAARVVIVGAAGRMGQSLLRAAAADEAIQLVGAIASARSPALGEDAGAHAGLKPLGLALRADLAAVAREADVVIDFSTPAALAATVQCCVAAGVALLVGTTGFDGPTEAALARAAERIALLVAPNTSLGVTLLAQLVQQAAARLPRDFDIEITETHHRRKQDAPSGTALLLGRAAAAGRGERPEEVLVWGANAAAPRRPGQIGLTSVRAGEVVGEHRVLFASAGERLGLEHVASERGIFARGALQAANWLAGRAPGRYTMAQVLGFETEAKAMT